PYHSCGPAPNRSVGAGRSDLSNRELPPGAFRHRPVWHEDGTLAGQPERHAWPCSIATVIVAAAVAAAGVLVSGSLSHGQRRCLHARTRVRPTPGPNEPDRTGRQGRPRSHHRGHPLAGSRQGGTLRPGSASVVVDFEVDSLEVREGTGGVKPLTDADRAQITRTLGEVLH